MNAEGFYKFILHLENFIQMGGDTSVYNRFDYDMVDQKEAELLQKRLFWRLAKLF